MCGTDLIFSKESKQENKNSSQILYSFHCVDYDNIIQHSLD